MTGRVVRAIAPKPSAVVPLVGRDEMLAGFKGVVQSSKGTAFGAFNGFPPFAAAPGGVAGKTGTAQVFGKQPTSLFVSFFPADQPHYVVLALVEQAGHGANVAAPIVRQVIEKILGLPQTPIVVQSGND
jgi:penicillin-binding protein 2